MNLKRFIEDYFTFSRNERKGITTLLILIFLLGIANKVIFYFEKPARINVDLLHKSSRKLGSYSDSLTRIESKQILFSFNPNTIDSAALDSLDLPVLVKSNLLKFRKKNGKFYTKSDFRKIYGVSDVVYTEIEPYLHIDREVKNFDMPTVQLKLFQFDPNTASDGDFLRLGLSEKQIQTVRNYLAKGGSFKTKDDFSKIRGLREQQKKTLSNYIVIEEKAKNVPELEAAEVILQIELNTADSLSLKALPGIGDKLSKRIIKYRDILGGYHSLSQLEEVYGLSRQTIQGIENRLTIDPGKIRKLDLNFSDMKELSKHPYIKNELATKIVKFRSAHGSISDLSVLRDNMILNIEQYNQLMPYF